MSMLSDAGYLKRINCVGILGPVSCTAGDGDFAAQPVPATGGKITTLRGNGGIAAANLHGITVAG